VDRHLEADVNEFQYIMPGSLEEALALAARYETKSALLAGGTDLIVQMKRGFKSPSCLINLKKIRDLNNIDYSPEKGLFIGPLVTHNVLSEHPTILEKYSLLAEAARTIGTFQIRERGTIGGNICNASPAADTIPPLICLSAKLKLESSTEKRAVGIEDFFEGPQKTRLKPDEILTQIEIPILPPRTGGVYLKLGTRKALEIAVVGIGVILTLDDKMTCVGARIALASVAPTPLPCPRAGAVLVGQKIQNKVIEQAARVAQEEAVPISDVRGTAEYRREMVYVLTKRALNEVLRRIAGMNS
jgi:carbon-monoxide dehydrogenase medium subunit